jgi:peptidoglycan-associated lipoprotein
MCVTFNIQRTIRFALLAGAAISISACASHPKPGPEQAPQQTPQEAPRERPSPGQVTQTPTGPIPGSTQDFVINAGDRVYFDYDQYTVRADAAPVLDAQAAWLRRYPGVHVRIEGNCDERGTREYNFALGGRRANSVREYLMAHGVDGGRIETVSYGKERPIDSGENEEAWAHNRNGHTTLTSGAQ